MPRYVGKTIDAKVHVIDANGDPVTGAIVNIKVLDEQGQDWDGTWACTHLSDGIYYGQFTPDYGGDWTAIFSCDNPKFRKVIVYKVSYPHSFAAPLTGMNEAVNVGSGWNALFAQFDEDWVQRKIYMLSVLQSNDETAAKSVDIIFDLDSVRSINISETLDSGTLYYLVLTPDESDNYVYELTQAKNFILRANGADDNGSQYICLPLECRNYALQMRTASPGTNQLLQAHITTSIGYCGSDSFIGD